MDLQAVPKIHNAASTESVSAKSFGHGPELNSSDLVAPAKGQVTQEEILSGFSPEQQGIITHRLKVFSAIAYHIGKDFKMPVELNAPGQGWHWDFAANKVRVDPTDLLEKPLDFLRFVIAHEGGHRRISSVDFIPPEQLAKPGFTLLHNFIEDGRDNNFVAEADPAFRAHMKVGYEVGLEMMKAREAEAKAKFGRVPRMMQAGFEYIRLWHKEVSGEDTIVSEDLPPEVKEVLLQTKQSAMNSWWFFPSREEADRNPAMIRKYAYRSYEINRDQIWPHFEKLVQMDLKDQRLQEFMKGKSKGDRQSQSAGGGGTQSIPQDIKDKLDEKDLKNLEKALEESLKNRQPNKTDQAPLDLDKLPPETRKKLEELIDKLPEKDRKELEDRARESLKQFEDKLNEEVAARMKPEEEKPDIQPRKPAAAEPLQLEEPKSATPVPQQKKPDTEPGDLDTTFSRDAQDYKDFLEEVLNRDRSTYETHLRGLVEVINDLEGELRQALRVKRSRKELGAGRSSGFTLNIRKREQEVARGVPAPNTRAWQMRNQDDPKRSENKRGPMLGDFAITLLVDVSNSMEGNPVIQAFRAALVLTECCARLSIKTEVLAFNHKLYAYKTFDEKLTEEVRDTMGNIIHDIGPYTDTGWAMAEASSRLSQQKADRKFLIVLTDGEPCPSGNYSREKFELSRVCHEISENSGQHLIGIHLDKANSNIAHYFPVSLTNMPVDELPSALASLLRDILLNPEKFKVS